MPFDPELLKQLIASFTTELNEHTQAITHGLLTLESNNSSADEKKKTIEIIFRSAHNIKGTAFSLGINEVGELAHCIESLFSAIQKNETDITANSIDLCLEAVDKMHIALDAFIGKKPLPFDLKLFINNLKMGKSPTKHPHTFKKEHETQTSTEHESVRVPIANIDKISSLLEEVQVNKIAINDHYTALTQLISDINEFTHLWKQLSSTIKTHSLYNSTNDCFIDIVKSTQSMHKNIKSCINDFSTLSHTLQDEVRTLKMIPLENLLCTLPRYIRDLSHELNKQVELKIIGEDVKIDKAVLEGLKDPIIHLLRNSVDHGIESEQERKLKGKSPVGHITIEIKEEGTHIIIRIIDDGAGIDVKKIASILKEKNHLTLQEFHQLSESDILDTIFHSGFSTKDIITDISGRGIGLDVVKSNIEHLKGTVSISTIPDKGTTFTLSVPLTISSERGLFVNCSNKLFVIPTASVERVLLVHNNDIIDVQGGKAIILDNNTIPIRLLSDTLRIDKVSTINENQIPLFIVKNGRNAIAFIVDEIIGEREIVLKPLPSPLSKVPCVAGGTLLESNQVVIVLEPTDLINIALTHGNLQWDMSHEHTEKTTSKPHILVVDDSITTRTLEKNVLESKNYQVTVAVNGKEAWDILHKHKFSLIITDVMMPIMDGFTLTDHIKRSENFRNLPVIIVTSLGSDSEKKRGIEVGADAYIVKNEFESGALLDIVSQLI